MDSAIDIRLAVRSDVPQIVALLADDPLGSKREDFRSPVPETYYRAFEKISNDANQKLIVAIDNAEVVGTLQLTFITYLTYQGGTRAQIEGVRIAKSYRGKGLGKQLVQWAIEQSRNAGAHVIQLTTDRQRPEALQFYENLGFIASHHGMKLHLAHTE